MALTGLPAILRDTSTGGATTRAWDTGDGAAAGSGPVHQHAWSEPGCYRVTLSVGDGGFSGEAHRTVLVRPAARAGTCTPGTDVACMRDERYRVEATWWTTDDPEPRRARVVREGTNDSRLFRFFNEANWEILVKLMNGCEENRHVWVFAASTTDLASETTVTDTTAAEPPRRYRNAPGRSAPALTDTKAFPSGCAP